MHQVFSELIAFWASLNPKIRNFSIFVGGAALSAIIGATVLGAPEWWTLKRDRSALLGTIDDMVTLDRFIDDQARAYRSAWQGEASLESESERKGLYFTVDTACDGLRNRARRVLNYETNMDERELAQLKSRAERIYSRSVCPKVRSPIYYVIEGTENNWRLFVAPQEETRRLPTDVRNAIDRYRDRCTMARGVYEDRACREDEYATVPH